MSDQMPQGSSYNYNAYAGNQAAATPDAPARPKQVSISFWILLVSVVLSVLSVPLGIAGLNSDASREAMEEQLANAPGGSAGVTVDDAIAAGTVLLVIVAVLSVAITALVAFFIRKGYNWARIVLTVFAVLSLLALLVPGTATALSIAGTVLVVAAAALLYVTPAPG